MPESRDDRNYKIPILQFYLVISLNLLVVLTLCLYYFFYLSPRPELSPANDVLFIGLSGLWFLLTLATAILFLKKNKSFNVAFSNNANQDKELTVYEQSKILETRKLSEVLIENEENLEASISPLVTRLEALNGLIDELENPQEIKDESSVSEADTFPVPEGISRIESQVTESNIMAEESLVKLDKLLANLETSGSSVVSRLKNFELLKQSTRDGGNFLLTTTDIVKDISNSVDEVSQIINVIQNVANQTNLLAMNAAIEAAHADEAGAGFAVVAREIRHLSETTTKNSKEISKAIKEVISKIKAASEAAGKNSNSFALASIEIEKAVSSAEKLTEELETIKSTYTPVKERFQELSDSSSLLQTECQSVRDNLQGNAISAVYDKNTETKINVLMETIKPLLNSATADFNNLGQVFYLISKTHEDLFKLGMSFRLPGEEKISETAEHEVTAAPEGLQEKTDFKEYYFIELSRTVLVEGEAAL